MAWSSPKASGVSLSSYLSANVFGFLSGGLSSSNQVMSTKLGQSDLVGVPRIS